jgi:DNA-binding MarR family transcriptional regulator
MTEGTTGEPTSAGTPVNAAGPPAPREIGLAFLLVQLGTHAARQFAERLAPLGVEPRHVGMLTRLAANEGKAQQAIGDLIGLNPTQMVFLVDELESRGFVERRRNPSDRRSYALYLTQAGRDMLAQVQDAGRGHEDQLAAPLSTAEREQLTALLRRVAHGQGLTEQSLPGVSPRRGPPPA